MFEAEDRLADRLALAVKDKLVHANREKSVQAERKRKAAMFLSMLKDNSITDVNGMYVRQRLGDSIVFFTINLTYINYVSDMQCNVEICNNVNKTDSSAGNG